VLYCLGYNSRCCIVAYTTGAVGRDDVRRRRLAPHQGAPDLRVVVEPRLRINSLYAEISSIGEKPESLDASAWFKHLLDAASPHYQTFAGGRGFFRIPRSDFEAILRGVRG